MLGLRVAPRYASLVARPPVTRTPRPLASLPALGSVLTARTYAFSRFEKPRPGVGRERPRVNPLNRREAEAEGPRYTYEERPSAEESPLWEQSVRPPASDPEEGLRRILMQNDSLVVTRCAYITLMTVLRKYECMQADRDAEHLHWFGTNEPLRHQ